MHAGDCRSWQITVDALAHAYGDTTDGGDSSEAYDCGNFTDVSSIISSKHNFRYYCQRNTMIQKFGYRFNEYNPNDTQKIYPRFTDRVITAFSEECNEYSQVGEPANATVGDPQTLNFISAKNYTYTNGLINGSILIPTSALGNDGTTYIYRDSKPPANATTFGYGDRGIRMWVYRNPGSETDRLSQFYEPLPKFYECPITVSTVTNVLNSAHNITDGIAREAAASIALQGQFKMSSDNPDFTQWQWYATG